MEDWHSEACVAPCCMLMCEDQTSSPAQGRVAPVRAQPSVARPRGRSRARGHTSPLNLQTGPKEFCRGARCLLRKRSWSQKYDVWVFSKRQPVSADCSINASYPGWRETLWDAQGALEIKYNVWVAQFEVHYKKAIWIANEATHICMLIRAVSSLVCRLLLMGGNVRGALLRDCFCINYQLCPTDHFPKQTWNARSKGDSKIKIIDWQSLDFRI